MESKAGTGCDRGAGVVETKRRMLRVWVVEDHAELRDLFGQLLSQNPGMKCTGQFESAEAVLAALAEQRPPDIILMDVNLKGQTGLSAIRPALKMAPSVRVVMMTTFSNGHYELEAYDAGASAFLLKSYDFTDIVRVLREADRRPGAADLFPNLVWQQNTLRRRREVAAERSDKPFSLLGSIRNLWKVPGRDALGS
jgi:DNA-binding NarL/FixJ family response regulator